MCLLFRSHTNKKTHKPTNWMMMCVFFWFFEREDGYTWGNKNRRKVVGEPTATFPRLRSHGALDQGTKSYGPYSLLISWVYLGILISIMFIYIQFMGIVLLFVWDIVLGDIYNIYICNIHGCTFMGIFMQPNHDTWGYHGIYIYIYSICNQLLLNTWVDWINWNIFLWKAHMKHHLNNE